MNIFEVYETWPESLRRKLSIHDLRCMAGWAPKAAVGDWAIDTSAGRPILTYKKCSVIEAEDARYVLNLIARDQRGKNEDHGWLPIESAPKDGTRVIIAGGTYDNDSAPRDGFYKFDSVTIAFWHVRWGEGHWHGDELNSHDSWNWHAPKYWMPLPVFEEKQEDES